MSDPNMPSPDEGKPENPAPTPNPEPAGGEPAPAPEPPTPAEDPETVRLREENEQLKRDYGNSTREAQILVEQNKIKEARIEQLTKQHPPSEQELREEYPEWDQMLPHEQRAAKKVLAQTKANAALTQELAEMKAQQAWEKDLKKATKLFPALQGREDEFEAFVLKPTHRSTPIDVLAKAFLADTPPPPTPTPAKPGVERGSGGPKGSEKGPKWSGEQMLALQQSDPKKYREMLLAGEFDD